MNKIALKSHLDKYAEKYNCLEFIANDPIQIPHKFSEKEDIEIAAFFAALFAWGNRKIIINKCTELMERMDHAPYDFIRTCKDKDLKALEGFKHRTFNDEDLRYFCTSLQRIYTLHGGLENCFIPQPQESTIQETLERFRTIFFELDPPKRSQKHIANPSGGSAAKRLNMFLRWMVRKDNAGVDFGIWDNISPAILSCPLDLHSGRIARALGILKRKQNDWKAVLELDHSLRAFDANDPVKYDFALFGLGVSNAI